MLRRRRLITTTTTTTTTTTATTATTTVAQSMLLKRSATKSVLAIPSLLALMEPITGANATLHDGCKGYHNKAEMTETCDCQNSEGYGGDVVDDSELSVASTATSSDSRFNRNSSTVEFASHAVLPRTAVQDGTIKKEELDAKACSVKS